MKQMDNQSSKSGFTLILVLIMSLALMVLSLALLQSVDFIRAENMTRYYSKLAEDAAEAGTAYAKSCASDNFRQQSWTAPLTPDKTCASNPAGTSPYVLNNASVQTTFSVGNLEAANDNSIIVVAEGTTEVKAGGSSTIVKAYKQTIKRKVVWDPNLASEQSSSGTTRTCGILGGNVYCWGTNAYGQLGNNTTVESARPVKLYRDPSVLGSRKAVSIVSGSFFNCIITNDNRVYCWGKNESWQLAKTGADSAVPVQIPGLGTEYGKTVKQLGTSARTACALITNGDVYCWGANDKGQVGAGIAMTTTRVATPTRIAGPLATTKVKFLSSNGPFSDTICAITDTAASLAYCWGGNSQGQLGIGSITTKKYNTPQAVATASTPLAGKKVISIQTDGYDEPAEAPGLPGDTVNLSEAHTCAVAYTTTVIDAKVYCWGSNLKGGVGNGGTVGNGSTKFPDWIYSTPQTVVNSTGSALSGKTVTNLATGDGGSCVTAYVTSIGDASQRAYCWGPSYALGNTNTSRSLTPTQVGDPDPANTLFKINKVDNLIGGGQRMCARVKQIAYCWGANSKGQIGTGSNLPPNILVPTEPIFLRPVSNEFIY